MPYLTCPQCHASFHSGLLYLEQDTCPRCGAPFDPPRRPFADHFKSAFLRHRRSAVKAPDWETITSSQYAARQYVSVSRRQPEAGDGRGSSGSPM